MDDLEREAVGMVRQYGMFMPKAVKVFLIKLADRLGWHNLKGIL